MPNLKFSFADAHVKMREGGWSREVTQRELPIATALAGVNLRLTSGGVYASCIGTSRLSGHSYWQERRVSPPSTMTDIIADVSPGDLWCFGIDFAKRSVAHVFLGSAECVSTCQPSHAVALCRSPDRASRKQEYSQLLPETFRNFRSEISKMGRRRLFKNHGGPLLAGSFGGGENLSTNRGMLGWGGRDRTSEWRN